MDTTNLSSLLYFNMMFNKTDSNINNLLSFLLVFIMPIVTYYFKQFDIKDIFLYYFNGNNKYITKTIPYHEYQIRALSSTPIFKIEYSDKFKAIQEYIKSLPYIELNSFEIITMNKDMYKSIFEEQNPKPEIRYEDILYTNKKVLIDKENLIYYELKEEENDNDNNDKKDNKINNKNSTKKFIITLYKLKQFGINSSLVLDNFIDNCLKQYYEKLNAKNHDNKLYVFTYLECDKTENNINFYFEKNELDPSIDLNQNIFFEGRDEYIKYLSDFIYDPNTKKSCGYEKFKRIGDKVQGSVIAYGPPGEGKTSIMKATPKFLGRHVIIYSLNQFKTKEEMEQFFGNTKLCGVTYSRHQLCFCSEDIDAYNDNITLSRKNNDSNLLISDNNSQITDEKYIFKKLLEDTCKVTKIDDNIPNLQTFLNITDGIRELTGIFYMFTTNYFEKLDSAIVRDGRIDIKLNLNHPSVKIIKQILQHRFNISLDELEHYLQNKNIQENTISTATIIKICKMNHNNIIKCIDEIEKLSNSIDTLSNSI